MITIETLKAFGANTKEGIARCVNNETFYLRMINKAIADPNFDKLKDAIESKDMTSAFEAAHALKGIFANLSLDPILDPVAKITELLRARAEADYESILKAILEKKHELESL